MERKCYKSYRPPPLETADSSAPGMALARHKMQGKFTTFVCLDFTDVLCVYVTMTSFSNGNTHRVRS
jgi:hypothetical protein